MKDFHLTRHNLPQLMDELQAELQSDPVILVTSKTANTGSWSIARQWRAWMATTADFMAAQGCSMPLMLDANGNPYGKRPFSADDAHELFTSKWLGVDEEGNRLSWSKRGNGSMRPATLGERLHAMRQHENWCTEKGIMLFKPRDSEYAKAAEAEEV